MIKLWHIIKGWAIFIFAKRSDMASARLTICFQCPFRSGIFCGKCGCELHAKAEVKEEECPENKWPI
jgi:hypothetical protein